MKTQRIPRPHAIRSGFWFVTALWILSASQSSAQTDWRTDRILVQPGPGITSNQMEALHGSLGTHVIRSFPAFENVQIVGLPAGMDVAAATESFRLSGLVDSAEPDYLLHTALTPNDPYFLAGSLWYLNNTGQSGGVVDADIDALEAWDVPVSASNIVIAIVDTGVRYTHQDLAANMWTNPGEIPGNGIDDDGNGYVDDVHGINAPAGTGDPSDVFGHGTTVAGTAGAVGNNGIGATAPCWKVKLMACRFYDDAGLGSTADAIVCIDYARLKGANIINASWVSTNYSSTLYTAIKNCQSAGIIFVAGVGNDAINNDVLPYYPASFNLNNIVAVAATTRTDALASFSNYGATSVDLGAPGSEIIVPVNASDVNYAVVSGTSYSAPMASSVIALVKARYPSETYLQIINRVYAAVDPLPALAGRCVTGGRINLANAIGPSLVADFDASPISGLVPLTVTFTNKSFGIITNWSWQFGDGGVSSDPSPSHTFTSEGTFTTTLTVMNTSGTTSSKSTNIAVVANYQITNTTCSWIDPTGMTPLTLANDGISSPVAIPFSFRFYGIEHTQLVVGANGLLGFTTNSLTSPANTDLPNSTAPNDILCPFWDDLNPAGGGSVLAGVTGTAPNRRMVVSWVNVLYGANPPANYTFQAVLEETTHRIVFQYQTVVTGRGAGSAGQSATVGIENVSGTVAAKYSYNGSTLLSNNSAILFFLPPTNVVTPGVLAVSPIGNWNASGTAGGPFTPSSLVFTLTNSGGSTLAWTASASENWVSLPATNGTLAAGATTTLTATINSGADALAAGVYTNILSFLNTTTGSGNTTRILALTVNSPGVLAVSPLGNWNASGTAGGPFTPSSLVFTLTNSGGSTLAWTASVSENWVSLQATNGTLAAGATTTLTATINSGADALAAGVYTNTLSFLNTMTGSGNTTRLLALTVNLFPMTLSGFEDSNLFHLVLNAQPLKPYVIEASTNLVDWTGIVTNTTGIDGRLVFEDSDSTLIKSRFYRSKPSL